MDYIRKINLLDLLKDKSHFLFGPRATGKSYLIRQQLQQDVLIVNLLRSEYLLRLSQSPQDLEGIIDASVSRPDIIVIDEVQKIPILLDEVHRLIEERGFRFLLTGSSARKLKHNQANMLAGRAWSASLFPLTFGEIPDFNLDRYLRFGGLPVVYQSAKPEEELDAYAQTYIKEEILSEGLIRKLPPFSRFLKASALSNAHQLNFTEIGNDCQVSPSTVREYYSLLQDTLIGFLLEPWTASRKRKAIQSAKFYFFDTGVTHTLAGTKFIDRNSDLYGNSFEQFIAMELRAYLSYKRIKEPLNYWRTTHGDEVDFLIGDHTAIEVKSTARVTASDLKGLRRLSEEGVFKTFILASHDPIETRDKNFICLPWKIFLQQLWNGELLKLSSGT